MYGHSLDFAGNVDAYGYSNAIRGFLIIGWIDLTWDSPIDRHDVVLLGETNMTSGQATVCAFPREDVKKIGQGFVMFLLADEGQIGALASLEVQTNSKVYTLLRSSPCVRYEEKKLFSHVKQFLDRAAPNAARAELFALINRPSYDGINTLEEFSYHVHFEVDQIYFCPPSGFVLLGWHIDPFAMVAQIRIRCGRHARCIDPKSWISIKRSDVVQGFATKYGLPHDQIGFIAFVSDIFQPNEALYAEIEMQDRRVAFRPLQPAFVSGIPAIKELLGLVNLQRDKLASGFDNVIGPAVEAMNTFRLQSRPDESVLQYGAPHPHPTASIIVPLYGRIDFLEYQLGFFSNNISDDCEIIYVLDDPEKRQETEHLAAACFAKFERPFSIIALSHNLGYAPANNVGLRRARGDHICFLNSDVFPANADWLELLIATEKSDPSIGIVGALLTYEDGAIQHRGCAFERLPEFDNWPFPVHPDKGRRVAFAESHGAAAAVTGACMVMRRDLALRLGGFDEGYVIGDFEDADLCLRAGELGLTCLVDYRAHLYHLERQSQGQLQPWRLNLTLYNAWRFRNRWKSYEF